MMPDAYRLRRNWRCPRPGRGRRAGNETGRATVTLTAAGTRAGGRTTVTGASQGVADHADHAIHRVELAVPAGADRLRRPAKAGPGRLRTARGRRALGDRA